MVTRAGIVSVNQAFPLLNNQGLNIDGTYHFDVHYRVLKRGRKPLRWMYVRAHDALEAYTKGCEALRRMGYKI